MRIALRVCLLKLWDWRERAIAASKTLYGKLFGWRPSADSGHLRRMAVACRPEFRSFARASCPARSACVGKSAPRVSTSASSAVSATSRSRLSSHSGPAFPSERPLRIAAAQVECPAPSAVAWSATRCRETGRCRQRRPASAAAARRRADDSDRAADSDDVGRAKPSAYSRDAAVIVMLDDGRAFGGQDRFRRSGRNRDNGRSRVVVTDLIVP
jgi:hypothetical protein